MIEEQPSLRFQSVGRWGLETRYTPQGAETGWRPAHGRNDGRLRRPGPAKGPLVMVTSRGTKGFSE